MAESPRFSFQPLERRGIILGLGAGQLVTIAVGMVLALAVHATLGGSPGAILAVAVAAGTMAASLWSRAGRPVIGWAAVGLDWVHRRGGRSILSPAPLTGTRSGPAPARPGPGRGRWGRPVAPGEQRSLPPVPLVPGRTPLPAGIEVVGVTGSPAGDGYGAVRDRRAGSWSAVLPVTGHPFSLLDPAEQLQQLDAWRSVLAAVARPESPVLRLQWVRRSGPPGREGDVGAAPPPGWDGDVPVVPAATGAARRDYRALLEAAAPATRRHDTWLAVTVRPDRGRRPGAAPEALGRELRFLEGQLRQADLEPGPPLDAGQLRRLLGCNSLAVRQTWSAVQVDGDWHATYWVAEWPRVGVGPGFLLPLLIGSGRRTVSAVMAPVPAERALREVRSARTADLADAEIRSRAGFLPSARRDREAEGATRREHELADGHVEYRFSAYVSVAAAAPDALALACAELEQAAQAARLELRRLYGRQAEALAWTLPIGRGLR